MYRIQVRKRGNISTEGFVSIERALDRYNKLKNKKKKYKLDISIWFEQIDLRTREYSAYKIA